MSDDNRTLSYLIFCFRLFPIPFVAMTFLLNTKIKNGKKDSSPSFGSTPNRGSTGGSTGLRCPGVSNNYDCVYCDWHCNLLKIFHQKSDSVLEQDVWASEVNGFSVSKNQQLTTPTSKNIMSKAGGILVQASRKGTTAVAQSFMKIANNKPYGLIHYDKHGEDVPEYLNFWVTVDLSYSFRYSWGDTDTGTIKNVTFGQGSANDWWIISPSCDWHSGKSVYFHCDVDPSDPTSSKSISFLPSYSLFGFVINNEVVVCKKGLYCEFPDQQGSF